MAFDRRAVLWGAGLGMAAGAAAYLLTRKEPGYRLRMVHRLPARPEAVVDLVRQVEREPDLIPGVLAVDVLERGPDCVRYRVHLPGGAYALYCKTWEQDCVAWKSEDGSFGLQQTGMMRLEPRGGSSRASLTVETSFDAPVLGAAAAAASYPFAAVAFRKWLDNLGRTLARESAGL